MISTLDSLEGKKCKELESSLKKQQSLFTKKTGTDESVKASYLIANEIAAASKPFLEGEFIKKCLVKAAELVCPEKKLAFANISLSRNTVFERVEDLSRDLNRQLKDKVRSFTALFIALDESTNISDVAQLGIFICSVYESLSVTKEFVELVPMTNTTTSNDIYSSLICALDRLEVDWSRAVSVATYGAPSMVGKKAGVVTKLKEKIQKENPTQKFSNFHCILHQEVLCSKSLKIDNIVSVVIKRLISVTVDLLYQNLRPAFPRLSAFASKILSLFGTTYLCEQAFSVMNINKSNLCSRLTHRHLNDIMRVATTQNLVPDVDALVEKKKMSGFRKQIIMCVL